MSFPDDPLPLTVLAAFGADLSADSSTWPWVDITTDVRAGTVSITQGRGDETSQASPASCGFQLLNDSMAYSAYNPAGPNYPNVKRNTPIWVLVDSATRFFGYANGFTPSWDITGRQAVVSVSASGILRRLTQGKTPLRSPLYRSIILANPVAYWPLEDGVDSTQAASGIPGGAPMTVATGIMDFVADGPVGSVGAAQPFVSAANALSGVVAGASSTQWQASIWARGTVDPSWTVFPYFVALEVRTDNGKIYRFAMQEGTSTANAFVARYETESDTVPSNDISTGGVTLLDGEWRLLQATFTQSGSDADVSFWLDGVLIGTETWAGAAIGRPIQVSSIGEFAGSAGVISRNMQELSIAHISLHNTATLVDQYQAGLGYVGETATARLTRLCAEEGVPITITGTSTTAMGPQLIDTFVNNLRNCEAADLGLLYDGFDPGLGYITRQARENQAAALTLDMAADPPQVAAPFAPVDDDQRNRNLYKVDRRNGSSATYEDVTGPLGTDAIGVYDSSATVNVATDDVLLDYASWLVHMGTVEGLRYPNLNIDLGAVPALIDDWVAAPLNSRFDVLNVDSKATGHAAGTVSLLDEGYTETLGPFSWTVAATTSPYVYDVATINGEQRIAADGSTLGTGGLAAAGMSFGLTSTAANGVWTTDPASFPLDVRVGGERVTLSAITGTTSPQTATVATGGRTIARAWAAGTPVDVWDPAIVAL